MRKIVFLLLLMSVSIQAYEYDTFDTDISAIRNDSTGVVYSISSDTDSNFEAAYEEAAAGNTFSLSNDTACKYTVELTADKVKIQGNNEYIGYKSYKSNLLIREIFIFDIINNKRKVSGFKLEVIK